MKVKKVEETLMGPKHKATERCTIFNNNIGVLTKNIVTKKDMPKVISKNELHEKIMKDTTKGEP